MKKPTCPICEKSMPGPWNEWPEYPFCSKRCRTIDLGRWLGEEYRLPSSERAREESPNAREDGDD